MGPTAMKNKQAVTSGLRLIGSSVNYLAEKIRLPEHTYLQTDASHEAMGLRRVVTDMCAPPLPVGPVLHPPLVTSSWPSVRPDSCGRGKLGKSILISRAV